MTRLRFGLLVGTALAGALVVMACGNPGERAAGDGGCPADESCSTVTPNGLWFQGTINSDNVIAAIDATPALMPVAGGGTAKVRVVTGAAANADAFKPSFEAASSGPSLTIVDTRPPVVTIGGGTTGSAYLRILEVGTGKLYDRKTVTTVALAKVDVRPLASLPNPYYELDDTAKGFTWALWAGGTEALVARLFSVDDRRLADESMTLGGNGTQRSWDVIDVGVPMAGNATIQVTARNGAFTKTLDVATVSSVDLIEPVTILGGVVTKFAVLKVGREDFQCFRARAGTRLVAGAPWQLTAPVNITVTTDTMPSGCFKLKPTSQVAGMVTVTLDGKTLSYDVTPLPAATTPPPPQSVAPRLAASPGERAGGR